MQGLRELGRKEAQRRIGADARDAGAAEGDRRRAAAFGTYGYLEGALPYDVANALKVRITQPVMTPLYLEDFAVGQKYESGKRRVEAGAIKALAAEFDPQPFHLDEDGPGLVLRWARG